MFVCVVACDVVWMFTAHLVSQLELQGWGSMQEQRSRPDSWLHLLCSVGQYFDVAFTSAPVMICLNVVRVLLIHLNQGSANTTPSATKAANAGADSCGTGGITCWWRNWSCSLAYHVQSFWWCYKIIVLNVRGWHHGRGFSVGDVYHHCCRHCPGTGTSLWASNVMLTFLVVWYKSWLQFDGPEGQSSSKSWWCGKLLGYATDLHATSFNIINGVHDQLQAKYKVVYDWSRPLQATLRKVTLTQRHKPTRNNIEHHHWIVMWAEVQRHLKLAWVLTPEVWAAHPHRVSWFRGAVVGCWLACCWQLSSKVYMYSEWSGIAPLGDIPVVTWVHKCWDEAAFHFSFGFDGCDETPWSSKEFVLSVTAHSSWSYVASSFHGIDICRRLEEGVREVRNMVLHYDVVWSHHSVTSSWRTTGACHQNRTQRPWKSISHINIEHSTKRPQHWT